MCVRYRRLPMDLVRSRTSHACGSTRRVMASTSQRSQSRTYALTGTDCIVRDYLYIASTAGSHKQRALHGTLIWIRYVHNALVENSTLRFSAKVNSTLTESTSYTALIWTGDRSGVLTYDAGRGKPWAGAFSIRFTNVVRVYKKN